MRVAALVSAVALLSGALPSSAQVQGYYRFPTVHEGTVVFTSEGDLWVGSVAGGTAHRLTTHAGQEAFPVLSPDGRRVAFAASYEGAPEVYVMPVEGGTPTRLTWDGGSSLPVAWSPDGRVVYRTSRYSTLPSVQLVAVDPATLERERIPLYEAAEVAYGPDGTLVFTRQPRQGSNSRWYKGGSAQNLWKWKPGDAAATPLTADWPGTSKAPYWHDGRIVFLSDRGGMGMNVWSMAPDGSDVRPHTRHMDWDIQEQSVQGSTVVYRLGAGLHRLDLATGEESPIALDLVSDREQRRVTWEDAPADYVTSAELSPDGSRLVVAARGEVFVAPVEGGRVANASRDSGVRHRYARFSADGRSLLTLSDASGEVEWWTLPVDGVGEARQITRGPAMLRLSGIPSPDGRWIAEQDYDRRIWITDLATGEGRMVSESPGQWASQGIGYAWSPDSRHLAYHVVGTTRLSELHLYDVSDGSSERLSSGRFEDWDPAWSPDGNWLYFLSNRDFEVTGSVWGARATQPHFDRQTRIHAIALSDGARWAFREPDEITPPDTGKATPPARTGPPSPGPLRVVPVDRGNYGSLATNGKRLFWTANEPGETGQVLRAIEFEHDAKPVDIAKGIRGYLLSQDGKKLMIRKGSDVFVVDATAGAEAKLDDGKVDLSGWQLEVDKDAEWRQIFVDAWRLHRDYFYDPEMHGVDWEAVRAKYEPLVGRIGAREELADLQAQVISELSLLHSNAGGGDTRSGTDDVEPASLGAVFTRDGATGGFRVEHVYRTDPDLPGTRAPLAHPDAAVAEGAVILSVNGRPASGAPDIGALLRGEAGRQVRLRVRDADGTGRDVVARPVTMNEEFDLRYSEWEYTRRIAVDEMGGGRIGYVHLRAMGGGDMGDWTRDFYPVVDRQGLVIDMRRNGGGNIDSWVLTQLLRRAWMYFKGRTGDPYWNMQSAFRGHMVVLVDWRSGSDGEAFPDGFRRLGLGEIIGTRTWGGEVWLSSSNRQVDGGVARASETGVYGPEGEWLIEGWGVVPDQVVDNDPYQAFNGRDSQLEAAIEHLERLIAEDPRPVPDPPPYPLVRPGQGYPTPYDRQ